MVQVGEDPEEHDREEQESGRVGLDQSVEKKGEESAEESVPEKIHGYPLLHVSASSIRYACVA